MEKYVVIYQSVDSPDTFSFDHPVLQKISQRLNPDQYYEFDSFSPALSFDQINELFGQDIPIILITLFDRAKKIDGLTALMNRMNSKNAVMLSLKNHPIVEKLDAMLPVKVFEDLDLLMRELDRQLSN